MLQLDGPWKRNGHTLNPDIVFGCIVVITLALAVWGMFWR